MRTTSHTSDLGETIAFPTESVQYQMTILTLVTHMLLSMLVLEIPCLSRNILRHTNSQHHTIHLVLTTLALKRYHSIWFTSNATLEPSPPINLVLSLSASTSIVCESPISSISRHTLSPIYQLITSQLLITSLFNQETSKWRPRNTQDHTQRSFSPRPAKRYKTQPS